MKVQSEKGSVPAFIFVILVLVLLVVLFVRSESGPEFDQTELKLEKLIEENNTSLEQ